MFPYLIGQIMAEFTLSFGGWANQRAEDELRSNDPYSLPPPSPLKHSTKNL